MQNSRRVLVAALCSLLVTCGGTDENTPPAVASVKVTAAGSLTLTSLNDTLQLTAEALDASGATLTGHDFTWSTSSSAVVSVTTTGLATGLKNGSATITATTGSVSASVTVAVTQAVHSVTLVPATVTLRPGGTQQFAASAFDARSNPVAGAPLATFVSGDPSAFTISLTGLATAQSVAAATTSTLTATISGVSATSTVGVDPSAPSISSITVTGAGAAPQLASVGATLQLTAHAFDAANVEIPGLPYSWSSSTSTVATVDASTGLVTATGNGTTTITAHAFGAAGTAVITVQQAVSSITVTAHGGASTTLVSLGDTLQLDGAALDANGHAVAGASLTWSSTTSSVATIDDSGLVTAVANGITRLQAHSGAIAGSLDLTVAQAVAAVSVVTHVSAATTTLASLGDTLQLDALATDARGHAIANVSAAWSSDHASFASVGAATGLVTAVANGAARITAAAGSTSGFLDVLVAQAPAQVTLASSLTPATLTAIGDSLVLTASLADARGHAISGSSGTFTFSIQSGTSVSLGAISSTSATIVAAANGTSTIKGALDGSALSGTFDVTVAQDPANIVVTTATTTTLASLGETVQLSASATDHNGHAVPSPTFAWTSSTPAVATVGGSTGLVTAVANGSSTIHAKAGTGDGALAVSVLQLAASIAISPTSTVFASGKNKTLTATAKDARGNSMSGASFTWSADAGLSITQSGVVSGTTTNGFTGLVTATSGSFSATSTVSIAVYKPFSFTTASSPSAVIATVNQNEWVIFSNPDSAPHGVRHNPSSGSSLFQTNTFSGGTDSSALQLKVGPASYPVDCIVHGTSMSATLVVQ
ncbi:MAG: Ig-like domain-containing protein [Deltaproteobacteria bacterium]|nr:Ig-like domain-containing protein [Deltaproteobacteria bacterium]